MKPETKLAFHFDTSLIEQMACPACLGEMRLEGAPTGGVQLACFRCGSAYLVVDGIPVLTAKWLKAGRG